MCLHHACNSCGHLGVCNLPLTALSNIFVQAQFANAGSLCVLISCLLAMSTPAFAAVSIDSTTPRNLEEAATTLHEESTKATKSFPEASGSPPAHSSSLDKIEIDEGSMPIQKITADQRASFAHHSFDALVRHEVDGLLKAGAHDDSLRLEVLIGKGAWGAVYKGKG
eukprot:1161327-Pelagomonas_calceolata.AAC.7